MKKRLRNPQDKPFFCHDENLEFATLKKECNQQARFISVTKVLKKPKPLDPEIISKCNQKDFHIITHNTRHFLNPRENSKSGIICVGLRAEYHWVPKFKKLLRNFRKHKDYYFKSILIAETVTIRDRKTGEIRLL